ncbi:hypothetical protein FZI85_19645 [Mycobacterium sp. CBMA293]|nr:hypothetical protein [Mycolicibacterium sp. CBMA 360]MUL60897.1 hypothetical protein [Mycolicibacterium sp. CBMA 335]MUL71910.1 hypothetical protein [Mycolicibacterium sp. CBMA 311]MUL95838.1 hypothetical protein [Mycolicibacterium sp. CBMA 230]MUM13225.1 hypothetical protein [Mycolicibacterium sp. CBMA 293]MUM32199.1 hypothetical protein [Mycolicibacterium sp. CBMA 361]
MRRCPLCRPVASTRRADECGARPEPSDGAAAGVPGLPAAGISSPGLPQPGLPEPGVSATRLSDSGLPGSATARISQPGLPAELQLPAEPLLPGLVGAASALTASESPRATRGCVLASADPRSRRGCLWQRWPTTSSPH